MAYKINEDLYIGNTNKQLKDLLAHYGDTLPIGGIVNYDGSTVPEGYESVGNDYSTNEINTGKTWIDGKSIYRKVLNIGTVTSQKTFITHNIANLGKLVNLYGTFNRDDNAQQTMPGNYTNWETYLYDVSSEYLTIYFSDNQWSRNPYDIVIVMEYTKTTD